jgi:mono/diheme cytochrome c family protein
MNDDMKALYTAFWGNGSLAERLKDAPDEHSVVLSVGKAKALVAAAELAASHAAEVEALRSALRPFAAICEGSDVWEYCKPHILAARAALKE